MPSVLTYFRRRVNSISGTTTLQYPGVCPPESPAQPANEAITLLGEAPSLNPDPHSRTIIMPQKRSRVVLRQIFLSGFSSPPPSSSSLRPETGILWLFFYHRLFGYYTPLPHSLGYCLGRQSSYRQVWGQIVGGITQCKLRYCSGNHRKPRLYYSTTVDLL